MKKDKKILHLDKAPKAYDNLEFIHSSEGRTIRLLSEYLYPLQHLKRNNIKKTIIVFGSARIISDEQYNELLDALDKEYKNARGKARKILEMNIEFVKNNKHMCRYYDEAFQLSKKIAEWSQTLPVKERFHICTGGGPGIMEAANKGAAAGGGLSIGFNISLPHEQYPNPFITPNLNFEFHYFFMRKFWFVYTSYALIVFPGGFGTMDELMEILTLTQTKKLGHVRPVLLYSEKFWKEVINFDNFFEYVLISPQDLKLFKFVNTPDEAFNVLVEDLSRLKKINML